VTPDSLSRAKRYTARRVGSPNAEVIADTCAVKDPEVRLADLLDTQVLYLWP